MIYLQQVIQLVNYSCHKIITKYYILKMLVSYGFVQLYAFVPSCLFLKKNLK